jgi:hypothetical protein
MGRSRDAPGLPFDAVGLGMLIFSSAIVMIGIGYLVDLLSGP